MKTRNISTMLLATGLLTTIWGGCSNEAEQLTISKPSTGKRITVTASQSNPITRLSYNAGNGGLNVAWSENDAFKMYKGESNQGEVFTLTGGANSASGTFDGIEPTGGNDDVFFACYPAAKAGVTWDETIFDIRGQIQEGAYSKDHLSNYDFMIAQPTDITDVSFRRRISILKFQVELPTGKYPNTLILQTTSDAGFCITQKADGTLLEYSKQLCMQFAKDATGASANYNTFEAYMAVFGNTVPANEEMEVKIITVDGTIYRYKATVQTGGINYDPGYIYNAVLTATGGAGKALNTTGSEYNSTVANKGLIDLDHLEGNGDSSIPYSIKSADDLQYMMLIVASQTNNAHKAHYRLETDIKLNYANWMGIGTTSQPFQGVFDGNGHIITGSNIILGFFGATQGVDADHPAIVRNLIITADATAAYYIQGHVGIVVTMAKEYSECSNCTVTSTIKYTDEEDPLGTVNLGGIVGTLAENATIKDCTMNGHIDLVNMISESSNYHYIGGICGNAVGSILRCTNNGSIQTNGGYKIRIGGIAGCSKVVEDCTNFGNITTTGSKNPTHIGGITGYFLGTSIAQCINKGHISVTGYNEIYVGGVVGFSHSEAEMIEGCTNSGRIEGVTTGSSSYVGGLVGELNCPLHNSHNLSADLTMTAENANNSNKGLGSLVGDGNQSNVFNCCTSVSINGIHKIGKSSGDTLSPCNLSH